MNVGIGSYPSATRVETTDVTSDWLLLPPPFYLAAAFTLYFGTVVV